MLGVFVATAIYSTWAYVWFFLVLVVFSPGYVEMWEACVTLAFMGALVITAYVCDKKHESVENEEERKAEENRKAKKAAIRILAKKYGMKAMLEIGQGHEPDLPRNIVLSEYDIGNINDYYNTLLGKPAKEASIDELLDCLQPENAVERIMYRKEVSSTQSTNFIKMNRLGKGEQGQAAKMKINSKDNSKTVGFKHLNYEVSERNGHVALTIEKKT